MELSPLSLAVAMGIAALAALWLARALRRLATRRRQRRARRAEHAAEALLDGLGYRVLERQPRRQWTLEADGEALTVELRADLLVARGRRRYVAEVKTGQTAPALSTSATRRQLLEYGLAYDAHGTLLVDMEQGIVRHVRFPAVPKHRKRSAAWLLALGAAFGVAIARLL